MRFETKEDLERERKIMDIICKDAIKLGDYELDFLIKDKAYIEIKSATCKHNTPPFYLVNFRFFQKYLFTLFLIFLYLSHILHILFM